MLNTLKCDLKKTLLSVNFVLSCIVLIVLAFSSGCVSSDNGLPQYSVAEFILKTDMTLWKSDSSYSSDTIFYQGFQNSWLGIFIPLLASFPCVPIFCDEVKTNCWRHYVERVGITKYVLSKFICVIIVSFCLVAVSYSAFGAVVFSIFPNPDECRHEEFLSSWYEFHAVNSLLKSKSILLFAASRTFFSAIITTVGGMFALAVCAVTMNKYISMGIPVLTYFFFSEIGQDYYGTEKGSLALLDNRLRFSELENYMVQSTNLPLWAVFVYFFAAAVIFLAVWFFIMKGRLKV